MDCKDLNKLFTAYLDGEVTPEEREQIQAHLSTCPHCREELDALAATQNNLRQALKLTATQITPSPVVWAEIRQRLKAEQHRATLWGRGKFKVKEVQNIVIRGLVSRQPAWKTVIASVLAIALIAGLTIALPSFTGQSVEAKAADIARNSPEVQAALGDGEIKVVKVITIRDDSGTVICEGAAGRLVIAEVDLKAREVTGVRVGIFETIMADMPEITEADKQKAIDIARADPRVQELLDNGASIGEVSGILVFGMAKDLETGETEEFSETLARVEIEMGEKSWAAFINLTEGEMIQLLETTPGTTMESYSGPGGKVRYFYGFYGEEGLIEEKAKP